MNIFDLAPTKSAAPGVSEVDVQKVDFSQQGSSINGPDAQGVGQDNAKTPFNVHLSNEQQALKSTQSDSRKFALDPADNEALDPMAALNTPIEDGLLSITLSGSLQAPQEQALDADLDMQGILALPANAEATSVLGAQGLSSAQNAIGVHGGNDTTIVSKQSTGATPSFQQLSSDGMPLNALASEASALQSSNLASASALVSAGSEKPALQVQVQPLMQGKSQTQQSPSQKLDFDLELSKAFDLNLGADNDDAPAGRLITSSSGLGLGQQFESSVATSASPARFHVNVQFGRAEWMADVAAQVSKLAAQNLNFAEIQLDPPELGSLQVRVQLNNDQAAVSFTAQSAQVREALEQNGNRLREMFSADGLNLVDVDVRDQSQHEQQDELDSDTVGTHSDADDETESADARVVNVHGGMGVDDYV